MLAHAPPAHGVRLQLAAGCQDAIRAGEFLHEREQVGFEAGFTAFGGNTGGEKYLCLVLAEDAADVVGQSGNKAELRCAAAACAAPAEQGIGDVEQIVCADHGCEHFLLGGSGGSYQLFEPGFSLCLIAAYLIGVAVVIGIFLFFVQVVALYQQDLERSGTLGCAGGGPLGHLAQQGGAALQVCGDFQGGICLVHG